MVKRNYYIDMMRCILMLFIVLHHTIVHGLGLINISLGKTLVFNNPLLFFLNAFFVIAVNCFFLISGYYGLHFKKKRFVKLLLDLIIINFFCNCFDYFVLSNSTVNLIKLVKLIIRSILFPGQQWFIYAYLGLYLIAPIINNGLDNISTKADNAYFALISIMYFYLAFIFSYSDGYNVVQAIYIYIY